MSDKIRPGMSMKDLEPLLKNIYEDALLESLNRNTRFFGKVTGSFEEPTKKKKFIKKWKKFWDHIPDFYHYLKQYEYENWRYWDKDGY